MEIAPFKKYIKPYEPPQDVDISHLSDPTRTTTNLDVTCSLDTSCDHLLRLYSPSYSSEPQDFSIAASVEIEFIDESEECLEINKTSPTDVFGSYHEYDLFLLNQEIDTPSDNINSQNTDVCENLYDILIHAPNLSHNYALPQSMAQHNSEDQNPTDTPSTVRTIFMLQVITPSILSVLIIHWKPSAINLSTLPLTTTLHYPNSWHNTTVKS